MLARYGYQIIRVWILTMKILPQLRAKGLGGLRPPTDGRRWTSEEADELALETVGTAIAKFRQNVLLTGIRRNRTTLMPTEIHATSGKRLPRRVPADWSRPPPAPHCGDPTRWLVL